MRHEVPLKNDGHMSVVIAVLVSWVVGQGPTSDVLLPIPQ